MHDDFDIRPYTPVYQPLWDAYVERARNATFLFKRAYMDYHADRFNDSSLLFFRDGRLFALLPAHRVNNTLYSHRGLTYGGLLMDNRVTAAATCRLFEALNEWLRQRGFNKVVYKRYHGCTTVYRRRKTCMLSSAPAEHSSRNVA